jgi:hypothetical protein
MPANGEPLRVSIVVPLHALGAPLDACLASIARCSPLPFERILACDGTFAGRDADAPAAFSAWSSRRGAGRPAARNEASARRDRRDPAVPRQRRTSAPPISWGE